jgi:lipoprotein-releasing system permease protein
MRTHLFSLRMAWRYLFARKTRNAINIITALSTLAISIVSAALVIILSAFNGLEWKILDALNILDPHILAEPAQGKTAILNDLSEQELKGLKELEGVAKIIEESALLAYGNKQLVAKVRGVQPVYMKMFDLNSWIVEGTGDLNIRGNPRAILGEEIADRLGVRIGDPFARLQAFCPKPGKTDLLNPFREARLEPGGVFFIPHEANKSLVIIPFEIAAQLTGTTNGVNAIHFMLKNEKELPSVRKKIQSILGEEWVLKDRMQQHEAISKILKAEKFMVILIVAFILLIASFNLVSVQTLLIVEKQKDLGTLWSLGLPWPGIKHIFIWLGTLVSALGGISGIGIGVFVVGSQQLTGWFKWNPATGEPYPVILKTPDLLLSFGIVVFIGWLICFWRMKRLSLSGLQAAQRLK